MLIRLAAFLALIALAVDAHAEGPSLEALDPDAAHVEIAKSEGVVLVDLWAEY
jgi:hypothetical protein